MVGIVDIVRSESPSFCFFVFVRDSETKLLFYIHLARSLLIRVQNSKPEMFFIFIIAFTLVSAFLLSQYLSNKHQTTNLPGGSLGYPLIGETLSFLRAQRGDRGSDWLEERISKHGLVFKTSLMGSPTVVVMGQAGNKFVLGAENDVLAAKQPVTLQTIAGKQNIFELTGSRYQNNAPIKHVYISYIYIYS